MPSYGIAVQSAVIFIVLNVSYCKYALLSILVSIYQHLLSAAYSLPPCGRDEALQNPNCWDDHGITPLILAVMNNELDYFRQILNTDGVDVNSLARNGSSALHYVIALDRREMFQRLLERSAQRKSQTQNQIYYCSPEMTST